MSLRNSYGLSSALIGAFNAGKAYVSPAIVGIYAKGRITIVDSAVLKSGSDSFTIDTSTFVANNGAVLPNTLQYDASGTAAQTAISLAYQINTFHGLTGKVTALADNNKVHITASNIGTVGNSIVLVYTQNGVDVGAVISNSTLWGGVNPVVIGQAYVDLQTGLASAAAEGDTTFTITTLVSFAPSSLRLQGKYWETFVDGVKAGLGLEEIYEYEVDVLLNTSDTVITNIDFNFHFLYA